MKLWQRKSSKISKNVEDFTSGDDILWDQRLVKWDALNSIAHASALNRAGLLSKKDFDEIKTGLEKIVKEWKKGKFILKTEDEDVHTRIENELGAVGKKLHLGRSRNDQIATDLRLYTKDAIIRIKKDIIVLSLSLLDQAKEHEKTVMPGYTHTRKAMPSTAGLLFASYAESLADDLKMLKAAYDMNDQCPLGTGAGYGSTVELDRKYIAKLLGFSSIVKNQLYAQNSRGKVEAAVLSALVNIGLTLNKMASDLILFSSEEFGFVELPPEFCTGSSIMPQKKNPDVLELVRARTSKLKGWLNQVVDISSGLPSGYNRDFQELKEPLFRSIDTITGCLEIMNSIVPNLVVDKENCASAVTPDMLAAKKAAELAKKGVPFRDAYKKIAEDLENNRF